MRYVFYACTITVLRTKLNALMLNTIISSFLLQIEVLDAVPDINMIALLPEILDGLFLILAEDSKEIKKM